MDTYSLCWGHDYLHNKHWLLQIPQSPEPHGCPSWTASSCPRKYHTTCLIHIRLNGILSSAYLAEQGKDYSYLITCRLQAISCKDLTSKKLLTPLVSRKPEGETVKQDKQSLKHQELQEDILNPISYVKVNTWPGSHSQEHLQRNAWSKHRRATSDPPCYCSCFRNFHGNNPLTIWTHFPCWWLVLVSAGIQRHKNCEILRCYCSLCASWHLSGP